MEIIPGVHKIDGVSGANCYLVTSGTETVLIDAGMRGSSKKIESYLKTMGKNLSDIKYISLRMQTRPHQRRHGDKRTYRRQTVIHNGRCRRWLETVQADSEIRAGL